MSLYIEGKIIRIINEYIVLINLGLENGVTIGNRFVIFAEGEDITDPTTGKVLGKYEYSKGTVEVTNVQMRFSEAQDLKREPLSPLSETIASLKIGTIITPNKLPIDENDVKPLRSALEKKVKVGDKVRRIS